MEPRTLVSTEDVSSWKRRIDQIDREIASLTEERAGIANKLNVLSVLLGCSVDDLIKPDQKQPDLLEESLDIVAEHTEEERLTWSEIVMDTLLRAKRGLTPAEIAEEIGASDNSDRIEANPNGHYNALNKLGLRGEVRKVGSLYYREDLYEELKSKGQAIPDRSENEDEVEVRQDSTSFYLIELLRKFPKGLRGSEIVDKIKDVEGVTYSAVAHPNFVYTVLGRLVKKGLISKGGAKYFPVTS